MRELENKIARIVAVSGGEEIGLESLERTRIGSAETSPDMQASTNASLSLREQVACYERRMIVRALQAVDGKQSRAARLLGLSRSTLIGRLKKYELADRLRWDT